MTRITAEQYEFLTAPLNEKRVKHTQGQSHLEAWDVRRHLIRAFGFGGYDVHTIRCELIERVEHAPGTVKKSDGTSNTRTLWTIVYSADVRLTVKADDGSVLAVYEDGATGDAVNQPSLGDAHDQAKKTALSQALKRCAVNLGDQFGLSLYRDGSVAPVVQRSLVAPESAQPQTPPAGEVSTEQPASRPRQDPHHGADSEYSARRPQDVRRGAFAKWTRRGITTHEQRLTFCATVLGRTVDSTNDLAPRDWLVIDRALNEEAPCT